MYYYKINVLGQNGYSFMIETDNELHNSYEAIGLALYNDLFYDIEDSDIAEVDNLVSEHDIEQFKSCGWCHYTAYF